MLLGKNLVYYYQHERAITMITMRRSMALLVFTVIGIGGCAHEWSSMSEPHPVTIADMQAVLRDEWSRHLSCWITQKMI